MINGSNFQCVSGIDLKVVESWSFISSLTDVSNIKVAIVDDGVEDHEDLMLNGVSKVLNGFPSINHGRPKSVHAHGQCCAGIVAATPNNWKGLVGIDPNATIIPIRNHKVVNVTSNYPHSTFMSNRRIAKGIRKAWEKFDADILNNSWGHVTMESQQVFDAIETATDKGRNNKGCVVIVSSGNDFRTDSINFLGRIPKTISVGAIQGDGMRGEYSNFSPDLCVVAFGGYVLYDANNNAYCDIRTIDREGNKGYTTGNYYDYFGMTSAAAPMVSGVASLMLSVNPNLTGQQVKDIIEQTAQKLPNYIFAPVSSAHPNGTWNDEVGYGLVDAHKAVVHAYMYGHDVSLSVDEPITCSSLSCVCDIWHPELFTYEWTCSSNMSISSQNGNQVTLVPLSSGTGTVSVNVLSYGRIMYTQTVTVDLSAALSNSLQPVVTTPTTISCNTQWSNNNMLLPTTLTIDTLATLTITGILHCTPTARIIVRPGGKLVVDGGTLTSACTGEMWQGICVEGHSNLHQTAANQGKVVLRNGAVIENALCGIRTGAPGDTSTTSTGGIITAEDAIFHNCNMAVYMRPYTDYTATGLLKPNASSFYRCTFSVDNAYYGLPGSEVMARLWGVAGVRFGGCTFSLATTPMNTGRSYGIYSEDAGFTVDTYCSQEIMNSDCSCPSQYATLSSFSGFYKAVNVNTSGSPFAVTIDEVSFSNNQTGVFVSGNNHTTVTRCQFDLSTAPETTSPAAGLELSACTGFLVEGNAFSRSSSSFPTYGIKVAGLGIPNNSLYRNTFSGLTYGIHASGVNSGLFTGLRFSCNTFLQNTHDIYVASGQVAETQGSSAAGADNSFSSGATGNFEVVNPKCWLDYYYSTGGSHSPTVHTSNVLLHPNALANGCASTLCTGGGVIKGLTEYRALSNSIDGVSADNYDADGRTDRIAVLQEMSDITSENIRGIEGGDTIDVVILKDWFSAISETWAKYSLAETEYFSDEDNTPTLLGISALLATPEERDEYDNYMAFNALKEALSGDIDGHANWLVATEGQIAELQRIAEAGTGRSSVMARGVLCFFFDICYDGDFTPTGDIRRLASTGEAGAPSHNSDVSMKLYPNPAGNTLHVEFEGTDNPQGTITVTDLTGVVVLTQECHNPVTQLDVSNLSPGLYVVSFRNEKGVVVRKFVKM